jgi:hypothetical protein
MIMMNLQLFAPSGAVFSRDWPPGLRSVKRSERNVEKVDLREFTER